LKIARLKTARLFGFAFAAPAYLPGARPADPAVLREAGEAFGTAFQVADDLSDADEDDRAPNLARAVGRDAARQAAAEAADHCLAFLADGLGAQAETAGLVRDLLPRLGL